jgi:hypothetical protein
MPDNPHQATLQPFIELHQADLADLGEQADRLREMLRRPPPDDAPKPPPRSALQRDLASIERAISKHEQVIALARDERVGEALQAVAGDPELAREAAADPRAFAARHGLELPETMVISMLVAGRDVSARISNLDPGMPFEITWTQDGFQPPPEPAAPLGREVAEPA